MESLAQLSPTLQACLAGIFGLLVGSFLNVVITRLPVMMMRQWRAEAREALELEAEDTPRFNLLVPASRCPGCDTPIKWHDNLPILGWLKRRGRCASCNTRISAQYPLVELAGGALGASIALIYGLEAQSLWIFGACLTLLVLSVIDFRTQLLPDAITLPLLWAGLAYQLLFQPLMLPSAVIGAMAGYVVLWSFYWLFKLVTGKEGMGHGDFKLLAVIGAWLGWQLLPAVILLSSLVGAVVGISLMVFRRHGRDVPIPFGPYLAAAGLLSLWFGDEILAGWYAWLGVA